jgi:hypothetical protein
VRAYFEKRRNDRPLPDESEGEDTREELGE